MKTVDSLLQEIIKYNFFPNIVTWKTKDKKILESLGHQLRNGVFFTENQANLLVKILLDYKDRLESAVQQPIAFLENPTWSRDFRTLELVKNISLHPGINSEIFIEFSYNKKIKEKLFSLSKLLDGDICAQKHNLYTVALTETNIFTLVGTFKDWGFFFDEKIQNFYNEIVEIKKADSINFSINNSDNKNLIKKLQEDIGVDNLSNTILLCDRKLKYQYKIDSNLEKSTLSSLIASRTSVDVFINSTTYTFTDILESLNGLKRLPLLVIFDPYDTRECINLLDTIHQSFTSQKIDEKIGIYFRMDNNTCKDFNSKISELGYNSYLDTETKLVGLSNKQLPKFIIKNNWRPESVICFSPSFKNSKIYSYCDSVDLKICHTNTKPVTGFDYAIM